MTEWLELWQWAERTGTRDWLCLALLVWLERRVSRLEDDSCAD